MVYPARRKMQATWNLETMIWFVYIYIQWWVTATCDAIHVHHEPCTKYMGKLFSSTSVMLDLFLENIF